MSHLLKILTIYLLTLFSSLAWADDDYRLSSDTGYIDGEIETKQHIHYPGDTLDVRVSFTGEMLLLASQGVEAHLIVQDSFQNATVIPIENYEDFTSKRMFFVEGINVDILPEGNYQLALILTLPGGDPLNITDWYNGFAGLLDTDSIRSSDSFLENDLDQNGEYDDDYDRDGFHGDDDDEHEYYHLNGGDDSNNDRDWDDDDWDDDDWDDDDWDDDDDDDDDDD